MANQTKSRRPSDQPSVLAGQLLRELQRLKTEGDEAAEPELYRAYLSYAQTLAWEGVASGNLEAPRRLLDHLLTSQPLADAYRPEIRKPLEKAALEVGYAIRSLYLACEAVEDQQKEVRLKDSRSVTEREVLRVLANHRGEYLRRGDVYEELPANTRPTVVRVGQILLKLYQDGLLKRIENKAQGNPNASFYALSAKGADLCQRLGLVEQQSAAYGLDAPTTAPEEATLPPMFHQAVSTLLDSKVPISYRRLVAGLLTNMEYGGPPELLALHFQSWLDRSDLDSGTRDLVRSVAKAWEFRLKGQLPAAESDFLAKMLQVVQERLNPSKLRVFAVSEANTFVAVADDEESQPSKHLREVVEQASQEKRSVTRNIQNKTLDVVVHNGHRVTCAFEIKSSVPVGEKAIEDLRLFLSSRSSRAISVNA